MEKPKMTPEELYHQYECSAWTRRGKDKVIDLHIDNLERESEKVKQSIDFELDVAYGDTKRQTLDIFGAKSVPADAPMFVFIHGGYWHLMKKETFSGLSGQLVKAGAVVVIMEYELAPEVTLKQIIEMVTKGTKYILNMAKSRGSRGVYISGHSAGGHLTAMMLSQDFSQDELSLIKGALPMSGVFDVRPLIYYNCNDHLKLTEEVAWECSPAKYIDKVLAQCQHIKVLVIVGGDESPEFKRQTQEYCKLLSAGGMKATEIVEPDMDHFELIERLTDPSYHLLLEIIKFLEL